MSLTLSDGPLVATEPPPSNYVIEGPRHRILWGTFPRRVRGELGGRIVFDTRAGRLLHESQMLPRLYVPEADVEMGLLEPTETTTHCPFKGDASYWSVRAGGKLAADAVWSYPEPNPEASWLQGHMSFYLERLDAIYDEADEVRNPLRDPYHRVDVRRSSVPASVRIGDRHVVESPQPWVLSETGLANRLYFHRGEIPEGLLVASEKRTHCPYMGEATWWSIHLAGETIEDAAWSYEEPFDAVRSVTGCICFDHELVAVAEEDRGAR